jgi:arylsulfatase A
LDRSALYWNYPHYHNGPPSAAIRKGKYKLIEWYEKSLTNQPGAFELYDLSKDMEEASDLSSQNPELVNQLKKELADWRKRIGAQVPLINTK